MKCWSYYCYMLFSDCEDCGKEYDGDCPIHGPLNIVEDAEVSICCDSVVLKIILIIAK